MPEHCPDNCPIVPRVLALERANEQHSQTHREIFGRLNKIEQDNAVQIEQYRNIMDRLDTSDQKHDAMNAKLDALEAKPGKRWESLIDKIVWAVAAAVIAFMLAQIGL